MNLLYLHAAIPVGFFEVRVIISCCIFMSCLRYCLAYAFVVGFSSTHGVLFQINVFCDSRAEVVLW